MERAVLCARTGATGRWPGELSRLPPEFSILTNKLKPQLRPSLGNPHPEPHEEEPKERARRGKQGRWGRGISHHP
jgi:hypothetical protein